jgi:hypothetical protein
LTKAKTPDNLTSPAFSLLSEVMAKAGNKHVKTRYADFPTVASSRQRLVYLPSATR